MSEYAVMAAATKPPYTTLTAYDLNTGEIKWQVPTGRSSADDRRGRSDEHGRPRAADRHHADAHRLVFLAGGDGKLRAYDEDTGKVLWTR